MGRASPAMRPYTYELYERGFPYLLRPADGGVHASLMARHLTLEMYEELKEVRTASGYTIDDISRHLPECMHPAPSIYR